MKNRNWKLNLATASLFAFSSLFLFSGCEDKPDTLGEHLEKAGEEIGDAVDDATDEVKDAAEDVKDKLDDNGAG